MTRPESEDSAYCPPSPLTDEDQQPPKPSTIPPPPQSDPQPNADELSPRGSMTPAPNGQPGFHTLRSHRSMPHMGSVKLPVSLAFKRTCYKCGNLGHHADECESKERLCYNCKQPGHESSQCPSDRSTMAKQCYFCKEMGHIQSECQQYRALRSDRRYTPQAPRSSTQPPSAQVLYYSQFRSQMPPQPHQRMHTLRHAPSHPQFYYPPPQQMAQYPQYPMPPPPQPQGQSLRRQPSIPHVFYPQYIPAATQHYGNQLISMRGYPMASSAPMCYTCGQQGHESKECTRR